MHLMPMRFKDYTWPHNPEVYTAEQRRRLAVQPLLLGGCVLQDMGRGYQILAGEGVFAGENAYEEFKRLSEVFRDKGPGLLIHPVWPAALAYFVDLKVTERPLPDYVKYRFEFWEDLSGYDGTLRENDDGGTAPHTQQTAPNKQEESHSVYLVRKGDTLWGIAHRFGVSLQALIAANPKIRNPNLIYPGDKVVIP